MEKLKRLKRNLSFIKQWVFGAKDSIQWVFPEEGDELRLIPRKLGLFEYLEYKEHRFQQAVSNGVCLTQNNNTAKNRAERCNHRKGGTWANYVSNGGWGSEFSDYAVIKHQFPWGDTWVMCQRCPKKWKPGDEDYEEALKFPTRNVMSTSAQLRLSPDSLAVARKLTKES